jgi:SAC3/GANP family
MVRKDFILQNYVGTGGRCDARAVRCHERIARWHCMCEHQLSHITDFVVMQSQQNVQELGQTMKTLNQFYDDSMGRVLIEVPDDDGRETRTDMSGFDHGCEADTVQGPTPVDYDGSPLANDDEYVKARLIGKHALHSPHHGTAEPEMRALYILLTIDNDGGMEVLKYAARLFQERPEVYNTEPVQRALSIYKVCDTFACLSVVGNCFLTPCLSYSGKERQELCSLLFNTSFTFNAVPNSMPDVQARGSHAEISVSNLLQDLRW